MIEHDNTTRRLSPFGFRLGEMAIAGFLSLIVVLTFMALSEATRHWCVIPLLACGTLIGCDAVGWLRGRLDTFDPVGLLGLLGTHVLFFAPLLHIHLDLWMRYVDPPPDWRDWLGWMAVINAVGLLLYRFAGSLLKYPRPSRTIWTLRSSRFVHLLAVGLLATGCLQAWVYLRHGGLEGYLDAYTSRSGEFSGQGWIFMLSESFPLLVTFLYVVVARRAPVARTWRAFLLFLLFLLACKLVFGGLRGSRSNTVWGLFWAVALFHLLVRPVPRRLIFGGLVFLAAFMYVYGFFKGAGTDALRALEGAEARAELEARTGRSLETSLLGDLGRADVQALLLYRLTSPLSDYEFALGRTYVSTLSLLVPRFIWPDPPPPKGQGRHGRTSRAGGLR